MKVRTTEDVFVTRWLLILASSFHNVSLYTVLNGPHTTDLSHSDISGACPIVRLCTGAKTFLCPHFKMTISNQQLNKEKRPLHIVKSSSDYTHIYTRTHARIHAHTHALTHVPTDAHMRAHEITITHLETIY